MNATRAIERALDNPVQLALGVGIVVASVYLLGRQLAADLGGAAGGIVSGDNVITRGTPYQGAGIAGTLGAATNAASGGILERTGSAIGGFFYDLFNEDANLASDRRAREILAARRPAPDELTTRANFSTPISGG